VIPGKNGGFLTAEPILILASNSPRRKQLLSLAGWMFNIVPAEVDETPLPGEAPDSYVLRLAEAKARAVAAQGRDGQVILSADTTVAAQGRILGKPEDANEAMQMLKGLRGRSHQVFTANDLDGIDGEIQATAHPGQDLQGHQQAKPAVDLSQDYLHGANPCWEFFGIMPRCRHPC